MRSKHASSKRSLFPRLFAIQLLILVCFYGVAVALLTRHGNEIASSARRLATEQTEKLVLLAARDLGELIEDVRRLISSEDIRMLAVAGPALSRYDRFAAINRTTNNLGLVSSVRFPPEELTVFLVEPGIRFGLTTRYDTLTQSGRARALSITESRTTANADGRTVRFHFTYPAGQSALGRPPPIVAELVVDRAALESVLADTLAGYAGLVRLIAEGEDLAVARVGESESPLLRTSVSVPNTDLRLEITLSDPYDRSRSAVVIGVLSVALVIVVLGLTLWLRRVILSPLIRIVSALQPQKDGELLLDYVTEDRRDEFGVLQRGYNGMVATIRGQIKEIIDEQQERRTAELKQLYHQIRPHLLENAFLVIRRMADLDDLESVKAFSHALQRYYNGITAEPNAPVPLRREIEYARAYLDIQRYRGSLQAKLDFDVATGVDVGCRVLPMILQPLIENAYVHGCQGLRGKGRISIRVSVEQSRIVYRVEDSGDPAEDPAESVAHVQAAIDVAGRTSGVGLRNIVDRLELFYGGDALINAFISPLGGVGVAIKFPEEAPSWYGE